MKNNEILKKICKEGKPEKPLRWKKFQDRDEVLKFIRTSERYWFGEGFGSEKRKTPA